MGRCAQDWSGSRPLGRIRTAMEQLWANLVFVVPSLALCLATVIAGTNALRIHPCKVSSSILTTWENLYSVWFEESNTRFKTFAVVSQLQDTEHDEEFYHLDLRTKCIKKLAPFPDITTGRAVGVYKGRPIACGGRIGGYGSSMPDTCYEYVPGTGSWTSIGNLVRHGCLSMCCDSQNYYIRTKKRL